MGKVPGSGRKKGTPNKSGGDLRAAAGEYTLEALGILVRLMRRGDDATSLKAAREILDRGCGKPAVNGEIALVAESALLDAFKRLGNAGLPGDNAKLINAQ